MTTKRKRRYQKQKIDRDTIRRTFENKWAWVDPGDTLRRLSNSTGASGEEVWGAFAEAFPAAHAELVEDSRRTGMLIPVPQPKPRARGVVTVIRERVLDADQGGPDAAA
jgi:hypothetical protein